MAIGLYGAYAMQKHIHKYFHSSIFHLNRCNYSIFERTVVRFTPCLSLCIMCVLGMWVARAASNRIYTYRKGTLAFHPHNLSILWAKLFKKRLSCDFIALNLMDI